MRAKSGAVREKERRDRLKLGLVMVRLVVPKRFAARIEAMAARLTKRHVENLERKDDE